MSLGRIVPRRVKKNLRRYIHKHRMDGVIASQEVLVQQLQKKEKIKVAFMLINQAIWKYERLYFLLKDNPRFEPVVFVCPYKTYGEELMLEEIEKNLSYFQNNGYDVRTTRLENGEWLDIKQEFKPDIVFFTTPWMHSFQQYSIAHFLDELCCYVPYGFNSSYLIEPHTNFDMHNFCWKVFCETDFHRQLAVKHSIRKGQNFVVTGYPGIDNLIDKDYQSKDCWKPQDQPKKKIIWAPHHTIPFEGNLLNYSTFLDYFEFFFELAEKYQNQIQFCFKPHPNLKGKLTEVWGKDKSENYYQKWETLNNGQVAEGDYTDLFIQSDALIHDSGSFVLEFFYTQKPTLFLIKDEQIKEQFNILGVEALKHIELGHNKIGIIQFVEDIIAGKDNKKEERKQFLDKYLSVPNQQLPSKNIYNIILKELTQE